MHIIIILVYDYFGKLSLLFLSDGFQKISVNIYDKLFNVESPELDKNVDFKKLINSNSLKVYKNAYAESNIRDVIKSNYYQFQRIGYFKLDKNSSKENLIFNKTVSLRDSKPRIKFD